jgi:hypothetical protein
MAIRFVVSERFGFNSEDVISILKGAAIAGGGAFATYLLEALMKLDFGEYTPLIVAMISVLINAVRKWIGENNYAVYGPAGIQ